MIIAYAVFFMSFLGLAALFGMKEWEVRSGRILFPYIRRELDRAAIFVEETIEALKKDAEKIPPELLRLSRIALQEIALALATFLRFLSLEAHKLADLVSHKHNFVHRAPRSEFLKKVIEHKKDRKVEVDTFE